jgi:hypothetical protein
MPKTRGEDDKKHGDKLESLIERTGGNPSSRQRNESADEDEPERLADDEDDPTFPQDDDDADEDDDEDDEDVLNDDAEDLRDDGERD